LRKPWEASPQLLVQEIPDQSANNCSQRNAHHAVLAQLSFTLSASRRMNSRVTVGEQQAGDGVGAK
jgi:hypothetical protein